MALPALWVVGSAGAPTVAALVAAVTVGGAVTVVACARRTPPDGPGGSDDVGKGAP